MGFLVKCSTLCAPAFATTAMDVVAVNLDAHTHPAT